MQKKKLSKLEWSEDRLKAFNKLKEKGIELEWMGR